MNRHVTDMSPTCQCDLVIKKYIFLITKSQWHVGDMSIHGQTLINLAVTFAVTCTVICAVTCAFWYSHFYNQEHNMKLKKIFHFASISSLIYQRNHPMYRNYENSYLKEIGESDQGKKIIICLHSRVLFNWLNLIQTLPPFASNFDF